MAKIDSFSLFKPYEQLLSPAETADFIQLLEQKIKNVQSVEISLIISLCLGCIWCALYGYILPYYNIIIFHGWADWAALFLLVALIGIPSILFLLFNSLPERLTFFHAILNGLFEEIDGEEYYIKVNIWGQISSKTIPYHIGGYALTKKDNQWYGGTVTYSQSSTTYYDHAKDGNRYHTKFYSNFLFFSKKATNSLKESIQSIDLEIFIEKSKTLCSIQGSSYSHLGRKGQLEKIKSEIKNGLVTG